MKLDEIINSWENRPQAFTGQKTDVATFIGPNSESWDKGMYEEALRMEQSGYSPEHIWSKTGNGKGLDGEWRQEISDHNANITPWSNLVDKVNNNNTSEYSSLWEYLQHDDLGKAYPGIMRSQVGVLPSEGEDNRSYASHFPQGLGGDGEGKTKWASINTDGMNTVFKAIGQPEQEDKGQVYDLDVINQWLADNNKNPSEKALQYHNNMALPNQVLWGGKKVDGSMRTKDDIISTMLHENQHGIQSLEGWGDGVANQPWKDFVSGNSEANNILGQVWGHDRWDSFPEDYKQYEAYYHQPVEVEARLTQSRQNLDEEQRRQHFPFEAKSNANPYGYDVNPNAVKGLLDLFNNR